MIIFNSKFISVLIVALLFSAPVSASESELVNQYLVPPFKEIIFGTKQETTSDKVLSKTSPSVFVAYFKGCNSNIISSYPKAPFVKQIIQPQHDETVLHVADNELIYSIFIDYLIPFYSTSEKIKLSYGSRSVLSVRNDASISTLSAFGKTSVDETSSNLKTTVASKNTTSASYSSGNTIKVQNIHDPALKKTIKVVGTQNSESGSFGVKNTLKVVEAQNTQTASLEVKNKANDIGDSKSMQSAAYMSGSKAYSGGLDTDKNSDELTSGNDSDVMEGLIDKDNMLVNLDNYDVVSLNEIEDFKTFACTEPEQKNVFSEEIPHKGNESCATSTLDVRIDFIPKKVYHGHRAELQIQAANVGNSPIYGLLLLGGTPERTVFKSFKNIRSSNKGYFEFFAKRCNTFGVKFKRPLLPGEKFITTVFLDIDKWTVQKDQNSLYNRMINSILP
jgi:hypothetical protein